MASVDIFIGNQIKDMQMADNFVNQPFGLNIKIPVKTMQQIEKSAQGSVAGIFEPLFNFFSENENVFSGDVSKKIEKYNALQYNIGALLRAQSTNGGFDVQG